MMTFAKTIQESLKDPVVAVSSDALVYRIDDAGMIEILCGVRGNEPWEGFVTVVMGGYLDPHDHDPLRTAMRETREETGSTTSRLQGLAIEINFLVGTYGPHRRRYEFDGLMAKPTDDPAHQLPVVAHVFAAKVTSGTLADTDEQSELQFIEAHELIANFGKHMAFDHARALADFLEIIRDEDLREIHTWALELFKSDN